MDHLRDEAFNTLTLLSTIKATCDNGSAVIHGGLLVKENIISKEIDTCFIECNKGKISDSISVQNNIYTDGSILPLTNVSKASLGSNDKKWNMVNSINIIGQQIQGTNANIKNANIDNLHLCSCTKNLLDTSSNSFTICLDATINIINLVSSDDVCKDISINIRNPDLGSLNDYKKIIFIQSNENVIKWYINNNRLTSENNNLFQSFDLYNYRGSWLNVTTENKTLITSLLSRIESLENAIIDINNRLNST